MFPNLFRLAAPYRREMSLVAPSGEPIAICIKILLHFENSIFNDVLKNTLALGTPEHRK